MNCPKCGSINIQKSKFNHMNGYDAYRCNEYNCNHLFETSDIIVNKNTDFKNYLITGDSKCGKTYQAQKILSELNAESNIVFTDIDSSKDWKDYFDSNLQEFRIVRLYHSNSQLDKINPSKDLNYIIEIDLFSAQNISRNDLNKLLTKIKKMSVKYRTNFIIDECCLLGNCGTLTEIYKSFFKSKVTNNILTTKKKITPQGYFHYILDGSVNIFMAGFVQNKNEFLFTNNINLLNKLDNMTNRDFLKLEAIKDKLDKTINHKSKIVKS